MNTGRSTTRRAIPVRTRRQVETRAGNCCEYCKSPAAFSSDTFSLDHVIPAGLRGSDDSENLALACQGCNGPKQDATSAPDPVSGETVPLFNPRQDLWRSHFEWREDFTQVVGRTGTGRATVEKLHLNRTGVVNLRRVLRQAGEVHPPADTLDLGETGNLPAPPSVP